MSQHEESDRHSVFDAGIMLPRTRPGLLLGILQKGRRRRRRGGDTDPRLQRAGENAEVGAAGAAGAMECPSSPSRTGGEDEGRTYVAPACGEERG